MKRFFTFFALLGAMLFSQQASAASYNLWIAGTQVTDANKNALTGITSKGSISGGIVTFNSSTNVLNIPAGVTIAAEGDNGITIGAMSLTIKIGSGSVTINSNKGGIRMNAEGAYTCTIEGNNTSSSNTVSTLTIEAGTDNSGFHIHKKCTGVINNLYLICSRVNGAKWGVDGSNGSSSETLTVKGNSFLTLVGGSYGIGDLNTLNLQDNHDFYESNSTWAAYFKGGSGCNTFNSDGSQSDGGQIRKATTIYGVIVCGTSINNLNAGYIGLKLKANGVLTSAASTVSYNNSSKTLSLNGATLKTGVDGIYNYGCDGLIIQCAGTSSITTTATGTNNAGLYLSSNTTIQGTGTLNITSSTHGVRVTSSSTATFTGGLTATIKGTNAVRGYYNSDETSNPNHTTQNNKVVFNNVNVTMTATNGYACSTFGGGIEVTNCDIVTPVGQHVHGPGNLSKGWPGYFIGTSANIYSNNTVVIKNNPSTTYPVYVAGRRLNSNNYQNISWSAISGSVTYTPTSATLTMNGATISYSGIGLDVYSGFNTLALVGTNKITTSGSGIYLNNDNTAPTISGDGTLEIDAGNAGIRLSKSSESLTVNCKQLIAKGTSYGIDGGSGKLTLVKRTTTNGATVEYAFNGGTASVDALSTLTYTDMDFWSWSGDAFEGTAGAYWDASKKAVYYNGGTAKATKRVSIRPITTKYNIWIAGKQLNNCNCNYPGSPYITAGGRYAVRYVPSENTLYLAGATITNGTSSGNTHGAGNPLDCSIADLTIKTTSASTIQCTDGWYYPLFVGANTTITGSGKLTIKGHSSTIRVYNSPTITFKEADVSISGSIDTSGNTTKFAGVVVDNSTVSIGKQIYNANSVTWKNGTSLLKPQGGKYDASAGYMKLANGNEAYGIEFGKAVSYGLSIDGTDVTNANNTDPTGDGAFSYDPNTKTLSVKKSYTAKSSSNLIQNNTVDGLIVNFTANATLTTNYSVIKTNKSATVKRSNTSIKATLNGGTSGGYCGAWLNGAGTLTIDNMDMTINSGIGIYGNGTGSILNLKKSVIVINAQYSTCLSNFENITGNDCGPVFPVGSKFKNGRAVDQNGTTLSKTTLIINLEGTGIEAVEADDFAGDDLNVDGIDNAEGIYDLNGRKLTELQRGVNIVRRRDGSTVKVVKK
ncbi:MAG: hypothetical protein IJM81_02590 [Prevotella sp.]|nr:hypothetical protein [Prevotella sp.]